MLSSPRSSRRRVFRPDGAERAAGPPDPERNATDWPTSWTAGADGFGLARQRWRAGWDRSRRPPPDPKLCATPGQRGDGWREVGLLAEDHRWREAHEKRRKALRLARKAGYFARRKWARSRVGVRQVGCHVVDDWRYTEGPAEGAQAVDPWSVADKLRGCGAQWYVQPRFRAGPDPLACLVPLPLPRMCGQVHACPVCAQLRSRSLAKAVRSVVSADSNGRAVVFLTLTHRARADESLADAMERWRDGWQRMTRGRPGRRWKAAVDAYYYGIEVTRGEGSSADNPGPWWHLHAHLLVLLADGEDAESFGRHVGPAWGAATAGAAEEAGRPGAGWDHLAGCQRYSEDPIPGWTRRPRAGRSAWEEPAGEVRARVAAGDWSGPWLQSVDLSDPQLPDVYQAVKYVTPVASLHPEPLAEFLATAHGRRWHQGGGEWRGVVKRAGELAAELSASADPDDRVDLGIGIARVAPGEVPDLDDVSPGLGLAHGSPEPPSPTFRFRLAGSPDAEQYAAWTALVGLGKVSTVDGWRTAVVDRGGTPTEVRIPEIQRWLTLPTHWVRERMFEVLAEVKAARAPPTV